MKKLRKIIILLAIVIFISSCEKKEHRYVDTTKSYTMTDTYSNQWYSISYPLNWITEEVNNQSMDVAIGKKNGDIVLSILHIPTDYSLPEINNMGNEDLRKAGARILSNKKKVINGRSCYVTEIYLYQKQVSYTFKENGMMYNIRFTSPNNWMDNNKEEINKIIQSFKIK